MTISAIIFPWIAGWDELPVANIFVGPSVTKISRISGKDITTFSFDVDYEFQAYKLKAVPATDSVHTAGTLLEAGGGGLKDEQIDVDITDDELVDAGVGDGTHIVKAFAQNLMSRWSV